MKFFFKNIFSVIVIMVAFFSTSFIDAQEGTGGIGGRPAFPREGNERSESIFIHEIENGEQVQDGVNVINNTSETRTVSVYATDSVVSSGGAFACAQKVDEPQKVGTWISLNKESTVIGPNSSEIVEFTIDVPADTDVGEHDGCIVIQELLPDSDAQQGIGLSFRTAIRVAIRVPGDIQKNLEYVDFKVQVSDSSIVLTPSLRNSGNVSLDASIKTKISHFFGPTFSEIEGEFPVIREQTGEWNFEHPRPFWGGIFKADTTTVYDENVDNFLGGNDPENNQISHPTVWFFVMPSLLALVVILGAILGLIALVRYVYARIRLSSVARKNWVKHTVGPRDDIRSIAKQTNESWRKIARVNKIKAPYTLKTGSQIRIPHKIDTAKKKRKSIDGIS